MAERFEVIDVSAGPFPLINEERSHCLVLLTLLDHQDGSLSEALVEVRLSDGAIARAVVPDDGQAPSLLPSDDARVFLAAKCLANHSVIASARAFASSGGSTGEKTDG
jgi:hypothetical protein